MNTILIRTSTPRWFSPTSEKFYRSSGDAMTEAKAAAKKHEIVYVLRVAGDRRSETWRVGYHLR